LVLVFDWSWLGCVQSPPSIPLPPRPHTAPQTGGLAPEVGVPMSFGRMLSFDLSSFRASSMPGGGVGG
jgi:hypothetical protein